MGWALPRQSAEPLGARIAPAWLPWLLGLLAAFAFVPVGFLYGSAPRLEWPNGDLRQQIAALQAYLADGWHWPPLLTKRLAWPEGANLIYADLLPGLALTAKVLHDLTGISVNYFGHWLFANFLLQPVAAAFLLRSLGTRQLLPVLCGCLLALALPIFLARVHHAVLQAHWLLLLALGLALRVGREPTLRPLIRLFALTSLLLLVNAYLCAMAAVLSLAAAAQAGRCGILTLRAGTLLLAAWLAVSLPLLWLLGYLGPMRVGWGFGQFSMNLLSPIVPQTSALLPGFATWLLGPSPHKAAFDLIDATGGQSFEGFNYLGLGLLLLFLLVPILAWQRLGRALRRQAFVPAACVALALWALSNEVWLGYDLLFSLPEPPAFVRDFRTTGRFFWPLAYLLLAGGTALLWRARPRCAAVLLPLLALLQLADAAVRAELAYSILRRPSPPALAAEAWQPLIAAHESVRLLPSYECGGYRSRLIMQVVLHAVRAERPVSTMYLGRYPDPGRDCKAEAAERARLAAAAGELLVVLYPLEEDNKPWPAKPLPDHCRRFKSGTLCTLQWDSLPASLSEAFPQEGGR